MRRHARSPLFLPLLLLFLVAVSCATRSALETDRAIPIPKERIDYDDGDTFSFDGTTIRVLGIDTPEITHREHGFFDDQPYGREAAARTEELLRKAKRVTYLPHQNDRYGRLLAHVFIDGELLAIPLIRESLAYETISHYGDSGFPEIAAAILDAAREAPKPPFDPPHIWRRENRREPAEQ
ncbi:MAG: thermonuclease family protein [Candidatus Eisenbacteria bacterium]|nr:thermonuclease family protein [Candidatus Eisenbacteria bacterium]